MESNISNKYKEISLLLKDNGIHSLSDIHKLKLGNCWYGSDRLLIDTDYPWVKDIFKIIYDIYDQTVFNRQFNENRKIIALQLNNGLYGFNWKTNDKIFQLKSSYSTIFPGNIVFEAKQFRYFEDDNIHGIQKDFLPYFFNLRKYLENGISFLLPSRLGTYHSEFGTGSYNGYKMWDFKEKSLLIEGSGDTFEQFVKKSNTQSVEKSLINSLPWLLNARQEDYIDIILSNEDIFLSYYNLFNKKVGNFKNEKEIEDWIKEISYSLVNLDILYKKKVKELKFKGFDVSFGLIFSVLSLFLPPEIKPYFTTIASSKTATDVFKWVYEYKQIKNTMNDKSFWIPWMVKNTL